jgi:hypothetical protein
LLAGDQGRNDRAVPSASHLEPLAEVDTESRQIRHRNLSIGEHKLPPPICSVSQAGGHSMVINTDDFHAMATLTNRRHHIAGAVLMSTNMPSSPDMLDRKIGNGTGTDYVQFALCRCQLIIHAGSCDRFLDRFLTPLGAKTTEPDLGMLLYRRQNLQKSFLPIKR